MNTNNEDQTMNISTTDLKTIKRICAAVEREYGIPTREFASFSRKLKYGPPRKAAMYLIDKNTSLKQHHIGELFGGRNRSTVCQTVTEVRQLMEDCGEGSEFINRTNKSIEINTYGYA